VLRCLVIAAAMPAAPGCERDKSAAPQTYGLVQMQIGTQPFTLELAATDRTRQHGLMHRQSLPADRGMIFVFADEQPLRFWMRNTVIPLDIIYLDRNGKVITIKQMKPLDETGVESDGPAKYAIEMNEGAAAKAGVKVGDVLKIPPNAREPMDRR
jgi:uncharacterized membrane protein (UPF0127 family)